MRTSRLLVVVITLQVLVLAGQWLGAPAYTSPAQAQLTDPGKDRSQMLDEMRSLNVKMEKVIDILGSGDLQVRVVQSDETKEKAPAR